MDRVLIFHISEFGGHKKASENIEEAFMFKFPRVDVLNLNGFGYVCPKIERFVDSVYTLTIKHIPCLWGGIYDRRGVVKGLYPFKQAVSAVAGAKILRLIKDFSPRVILATQAFPCGLVADLKRRAKIDIPLIAVVTDYYPHRFWISGGVDFYTVACEEARDALISEGVSAGKIKVFGIPISVKFLSAYQKESVAKEFGLNPEIKSVLLMGGGLGIGPIEKIAKILDGLDEKFQLIAVCGRNKNLFGWFKKNARYFRKKLVYFGYVDFVNKLMDFSDIIVTKAGGLTISESLAKGLGIIVVNSIPGQEERNVRYLEKKRAVLRARDIEDVPKLIKSVLEDGRKLVSLRENAKQSAILDSSLRITNFVSKYLK